MNPVTTQTQNPMEKNFTTAPKLRLLWWIIPNMDNCIALTEPVHQVQQHGHCHESRYQHEPQQKIPVQETQHREVLHPRPVCALHESPPDVVHVLGILQDTRGTRRQILRAS